MRSYGHHRAAWSCLALWLAACSGGTAAVEDGDAGLDPAEATDASVTASPDAGVSRDAGAPEPDAGFPPVELGACEVPADLPADPLVLTQQLRLPRQGGQVHMLDIDADPDTGVLYLVGTGGLYVLAADRGRYRAAGGLQDLWDGPGGANGREADFHKLQPLGAGWVAVTNRDYGLSIVDASTPAQPRLATSIPLASAAGMARSGDRLIVSTHVGDLVVFDLADRGAPRELGRVSGLGNPWDVAVVGTRAYVADNTRGLVVVDLSDPTLPTVVTEVATAGGAQDIAHDGQTLFVAVGGAGIEAFGLANPDAPAALDRVDYGSAVVSVSASEGLVWGTTHEDVVVVDARDPAALLPLGVEYTSQWAMAVHADGVDAYVADWAEFLSFRADPDGRAPDADPNLSEIYFLGGETPSPDPVEVRLEIANRGGADLIISGAEIADPRFTYTLDRAVVGPSEFATMTIRFADDGAMVDTEICLATNDPDEPLQRVALLESTGTNTNTGETAPDFDLPSVEDDNVRYRLSDQLGNPVVLVYFALW